MRVSGGRWVAIGTLAALTLGVGGYVAWDQLSAEDATSSAEPSPSPEPLPEAQPAPSVLAPTATDAVLPSATGVASVLGPLLADDDLGGSVSASVVDAATGDVLYADDAVTALVPASTTKILTATAALQVLGPDDRLRTAVVQGSDPGSVILVGAGDATLTTLPEPATAVPARASLTALATTAAAVLAAEGTTSVTLQYDARLFEGPAVNPAWQPTYVSSGAVAPVSALSVDGGRVEVDDTDRVADPAAEAARRFAAALAAAGVTVTGPVSPVAASAPPASEAAELATVESPTTTEMVEVMLAESDNDVAEALARLVAIESGQPPTFGGGAAAVTAAVADGGVPVDGVSLADGSGLSRANAIPASSLTAALAVASTTDEMRTVLTGLPVAGFTGTLDDRFDNEADQIGAGNVRAKTGTLNGVSSLAGTVQTADGRLLVFAFLADEVPLASTLDARAALDRAASTLATCGCR